MVDVNREKAIDELAGNLSRFVNGATQDEVVMLANAILRDHRTLQQQTFGFFLICIKKWAALASSESWYDLRNAWTVQVCKQITDQVENAQYHPPLI